MKNTEKAVPILYSILIIFITSVSAPVMSQSVTISANLSSTELFAGDEVDLTFSTSGESDVYFFSVETTFDPDVFEYTGIQTADLAEGGLKFADLLSPGEIGASVSRTSALSVPDEGEIMILTFKVKDKAPSGPDSFTFSIHTLADSEGSAIASVAPETVEYVVEESISMLQLTTPAMIDITEGDEFYATGKVYATGVTTDDENTNRIRMWVGVNDSNTDPATWAENDWQLMEFIEQDSEDFFSYSSDIAFQREQGVYFVTLRSDLDEDQEFRYGGINGYWHESESPSAVMEISQQPPFRYTIAAWDFDDESMSASQGVPDNLASEVELFGASLSGYAAGSSGRAANSNGWHQFEEDTNYWQVSVSTENFESLRISSKQFGSGTGPINFQLQSSLDGINWSDVNGGAIEVANNWTSGVVDQLQLPESLNDQPEVYIRWLQTDSLRISPTDASDIVASTGTNRIDDISITGINPDADRVNVWPGDTNNDGVVDELDVIPLGQYWLAGGPQPVYNSFEWEAREVEAWIPEMATYADAAGSGRVDQNDLQLIGLNFGKSHGENTGGNGGQQQKLNTAPLAQLELSPMNIGETTAFYLVAEGGTKLSGVSLRLEMEEINANDWSVEKAEPLGWGEYWVDNNRLIEFHTHQQDFLALSMVHKGFIEPVSATNLVRIEIRADQNWHRPVTVRLLRASVATEYDIVPLHNAGLSKSLAVSVEQPVDERPQHTELLPNYPNPFNPTTTLPYTLSEPGDVQIRIFDAIGRQVSLITREALQPGRYSIDFDASSLSSGIYFYQLNTNGIVQTRRMTLVK
ncbi:hypothetical protein BH23BAC3_BH23BAC3_01030 [soil metagenome]